MQNHEYRLDDEHGERVLAHDLKVGVFQGKQDDDCDASNQAQRSKNDDTFAGRKGGARGALERAAGRQKRRPELTDWKRDTAAAFWLSGRPHVRDRDRRGRTGSVGGTVVGAAW